MKTMLLAFGVLAVFVMGVVGSFTSNYNTVVRFETNIEKFDSASKNVLSAYTTRIKEMAQVPDMYTEDLRKIIGDTMNGRYGDGGSKAIMQFMQESQINFDSKMYNNLQAEMAQGRAEFKLSQDKKLDVCAGYENHRNFLFSGFMTNLSGFPKKDVDKLCAIVLDKETNAAFETHELAPVKLR